MWIFCGGMYRSGSTLQFQIAAHLVEEAGLGRRVEWTVPESFDPQRSAGNHGELQVFKAHRLTEAIRAEFTLANAKGVYIYRDLRDVCVSQMNFTSTPFSKMWRGGFVPSCIRSFNEWTRQPAVLISKYEKMIRDLSGEVQRIADHLEISVSAADCRHIADEYSVERQRRRADAVKTGSASLSRSGNQVFDSQMLLHADHIQSGEPGRWQHALSALEVVAIERAAGDWLTDQGYELSSPDLRPLDRLRLLRYR